MALPLARFVFWQNTQNAKFVCLSLFIFGQKIPHNFLLGWVITAHTCLGLLIVSLPLNVICGPHLMMDIIGVAGLVKRINYTHIVGPAT